MFVPEAAKSTQPSPAGTEDWRPHESLRYDERPRLGSDGDRPGGTSDPLIAALGTERIENEVTTLAAEIYAATCRWLELVAELDRRKAYLAWGCHSCAQWVAWRCSMSERTARDHVRVARRLTELPRVRAAFCRGQLSYSKVRAIAKTADSGNEADLVELARNANASQLDRVCRGYRRVVRLEQANEAHERRHVSHSWGEDGSFSLSARLSAEEGAIVLRALEAAQDELNDARHRESRSAEPPDPHGPPRASKADALVAVAEASLAAGDATRSGADAHQVVVHLDGHESAQLDDGPRLSAETARRVLCDSSLVALSEGGGEPLSVGRKTRSVPPSIRRALRSRDRGCRFPGCTHHRFTDAHHIDHWADGGETSADNLVLLCRRHHRLVHEGGFSIERDAPDRLVFRRPDGEVLEHCPAAPRSRDDALVARRERRLGPVIDPETCVPRFGGDRLDYNIAVEGLLARSRPRGP